MKKKFVISLLFVLMFVNVVVAQDITVHLKTQPAHDSFASIVQPDTSTYVQTLKKYTGYDGEATFDFSFDNSMSNFDVFVVLKKNDARVLEKRFEGVGGSELYITFMGYDDFEIGSAPFETEIETEIEVEEINKTEEILVNESEEVLEDKDNESDSKITGWQISNLKDGLLKAKFYIVGIVALLAVVIAIVAFGKKGFIGGTKVIDNSEPPVVFDDNKMKDAELKLKQAREDLRELQDELNKVEHKKSKAQELKERIAKEQAELKKLESGVEENKNVEKVDVEKKEE
ncbi:MAG: hypothetical protein U9Q06_03970 [Nanoarchaeota archaeon]|nr:hypothetical protein [Nanoarchaeota archaeon]